MIARILIIAGSDSGGGAGVQADIKAVTMMGGHPMTAIAALTAQNTLGVEGVLSVPADFVLQQIDTVASDIGVDAVKIGMIGAPDTAERVADYLQTLSRHSREGGSPDDVRAGGEASLASRLRGNDGKRIPIVFDPVMVASSGATLADEATIAAFRKLLQVATIVTPNAPELGVLTDKVISSHEEAEAAARKLTTDWNVAVLAKGGHIDGPVLRDTLIAADGTTTRWEGPRLETRNTHGTGCTLASAIAAGLGQGRPLGEAVDRARDYVQRAIAAAPDLGAGHGPLGHALGGIPYDLARATS